MVTPMKSTHESVPFKHKVVSWFVTYSSFVLNILLQVVLTWENNLQNLKEKKMQAPTTVE